MKTLIAGYGEIGESLYRILSPFYPILVIDPKDTHEPFSPFINQEVFYQNRNLATDFEKRVKHLEELDILHVCFPYSEDFVNEVRKYQKLYSPKYTIVHSTVPLEVYDEIDAISSPCLGIHPHLEKSMTTFTKFLAGEGASEVADYFRRAGMKVYVLDDPKATALMKILDTTFYGMCVEYTKDVKRQCDKYGIPFELWSLWTGNYNSGYQKLGYPEYTRPNLTPIMKKIGGHCVVQNTSLLETPFTRFLKELNG